MHQATKRINVKINKYEDKKTKRIIAEKLINLSKTKLYFCTNRIN